MSKARVTSLSLRPAVCGDAVALSSFAECAFAEARRPLPPAEAESLHGIVRDGMQACAWFVEADGERIGFLVMDLEFSIESGRRVGAIEDIYLLPAYRRLGLARRVAELARRAADALALDGLSLNRARRRLSPLPTLPAIRHAAGGRALGHEIEEFRNR